MKIDGIKNIEGIKGGQIKLDSMKDIKDFLKGFNSISEAKQGLASIIDEIKKTNPELAQKLEKVLEALDKAEKSGMTLDDFIENLEKITGNNAAATQGMSLTQQAQNLFTDSASNSTAKVNSTSNIA